MYVYYSSVICHLSAWTFTSHVLLDLCINAKAPIFKSVSRWLPGFLKLLLSVMSVLCVCVRACVCVCTSKAINYILVMLHLYNQLNKFVAFRKLSMHRHDLCNEAWHDRNQSNKAMLSAIKVISFTVRVVLMAVHE